MNNLQSLLHNRDVSFHIIQDRVIASSVDFSQSIGELEHDQIDASAHNNSYFVIRASISEVISLGIVPVQMAVGNSLVRHKGAIESAVAMIGVDLGVSISTVFSHENYFQPIQSAIAVTTIGVGECDSIKIVRNYDAPLIIHYTAHPHSGGSLNASQYNREVPLSTIYRYLKDTKVHEIIPSGSRGPLHDCREIFSRYDPAKFSLDILSNGFSLEDGAGPGINYCVMSSVDLSRIYPVKKIAVINRY